MNVRAAMLSGMLLWQAAGHSVKEPPAARPEHMKYERAMRVPAGGGQACAVLTGDIFAHSEPSLRDLRVFAAGAPREVPYAITLSETETQETQPAKVLNLGERSGKIVFDVEMPDRPYTELTLDLAGQDLLATAAVSGMDRPGAARQTALGVFTLFDLSSQRLARDTTLPLTESTFRYLHVVLSVSAAPGTAKGAARFGPEMVEGAQVPPSREAQTLYTTVAETSALTAVGRESRATFEIPARVPVERVAFLLAPEFKGNFSRDVRVTAETEPERGAAASGENAAALETVTGTILRVHSTQEGREIRTEQMSIPAILGANLQGAAKVEVALENGDDQPLPVAAVKLEMRQRKLCFDSSAPASGLALYYGDPELGAPVYDYERLFAASDKALRAQLGPEMLNPAYVPPPAKVLPFTERHPEALWIALIGVVWVLGMVALRSSRRVIR